jgi:hypothetical protein
MQKIAFCFLAVIYSTSLFAQTDSALANDSGFIKIHFLYGSKPKKKHTDIEKKWFGGLHGGHVSIEIDSFVVGFEPAKSLHIVTKNYNKHSVFVSESLKSWASDTATLKYTTITLPVCKAQLDSLRKIHSAYIKQTPYDYAFLGMRCAAATYDILGKIGLVKWQSNAIITYKNFYPKLLRKKLLKLAKKRGYTITRQPGRDTRKWEKD